MPQRKAVPRREANPALKRSKTLIRQGEALLGRVRSSGLTRPYRHYILSKLRQLFRELE
jgi:hypothetical protein